MISALIYVMLGLGLNIVVGLAGLLDLGYVAFYAVGAYAYALLNYHFGLTFWMVASHRSGPGSPLRDTSSGSRFSVSAENYLDHCDAGIR